MIENNDFLRHDSLTDANTTSFSKKFMDKYGIYNPIKAKKLYKRFDNASKQIEIYLKKLEEIDDRHN